ncbi:MAG: hypothetical protein K0R34_3292 [Herbinix sp.]|nr:hypothetical protein [Herbinix sp.]
MNSKELLEQAEIRVKRINELSDGVGAAEDILAMLGEGEVCFFTSGIGTTHLTPVLSPEKLQKLREDIVVEVIHTRNDKSAELEKLLGIRKPATVNPEFEAATKDMFESVKKPESDPLEEKLKAVLQDEAKKIEAPEKSQGKYPAEADVRKMYVEENRDRKYIANHYGISESKVNNYLFLHDIKRKATKASKPAEPEETERPLQG